MGRNAIIITIGLTIVAAALVMLMGRGAPVTTPTKLAAATPTEPKAPLVTQAELAAKPMPAQATTTAAAAVVAPAVGAIAPIVAPRFGAIAGDPVEPEKMDADSIHMRAISTHVATAAAEIFSRCLGAPSGETRPVSFQLELNKVAAAADGARPRVALTSLQPSGGIVGPNSEASPQWQRCLQELREVRVELPQGHDEAPDHGFITAMIPVPESFAVKLAAASSGANAPSEVAK